MSHGTILAVDDNRGTIRILQAIFEKESYRFFSADAGAAALAMLHRHKPDVVLLDVVLSETDGFDLAASIRRESSVPIIFLTARSKEMDRIVGLKIGGDDYITKPFSAEELVARVAAILRRTKGAAAPPQAGQLSAGTMTIDFDRHQVWLNGQGKALGPKEFELLRHLIQSKGKVLSREDLLERVWGYEKGLAISTRTVDQHIARLRRKLGKEGARILTVSGFGYRMELA